MWTSEGALMLTGPWKERELSGVRILVPSFYVTVCTRTSTGHGTAFIWFISLVVVLFPKYSISSKQCLQSKGRLSYPGNTLNVHHLILFTFVPSKLLGSTGGRGGVCWNNEAIFINHEGLILYYMCEILMHVVLPKHQLSLYSCYLSPL